jgi:hypothetical protein
VEVPVIPLTSVLTVPYGEPVEIIFDVELKELISDIGVVECSSLVSVGYVSLENEETNVGFVRSLVVSVETCVRSVICVLDLETSEAVSNVGSVTPDTVDVDSIEEEEIDTGIVVESIPKGDSPVVSVKYVFDVEIGKTDAYEGEKVSSVFVETTSLEDEEVGTDDSSLRETLDISEVNSPLGL